MKVGPGNSTGGHKLSDMVKEGAHHLGEELQHLKDGVKHLGGDIKHAEEKFELTTRHAFEAFINLALKEELDKIAKLFGIKPGAALRLGKLLDQIAQKLHK